MYAVRLQNHRGKGSGKQYRNVMPPGSRHQGGGHAMRFIHIRIADDDGAGGRQVRQVRRRVGQAFDIRHQDPVGDGPSSAIVLTGGS